jgi:hypothetical protein
MHYWRPCSKTFPTSTGMPAPGGNELQAWVLLEHTTVSCTVLAAGACVKPHSKQVSNYAYGDPLA